jgi:hypothetical protein
VGVKLINEKMMILHVDKVHEWRTE